MRGSAVSNKASEAARVLKPGGEARIAGIPPNYIATAEKYFDIKAVVYGLEGLNDRQLVLFIMLRKNLNVQQEQELEADSAQWINAHS